MTAAGFWSSHAAHLIALVGPVVVLGVGVTVIDVMAKKGIEPPWRRVPKPVLWAALFSFVAAVVHGVVCPEHFEEAALYGWFFLLCASAQLVWALIAVVRPGRTWLMLGLAGNLAVLVLWVITRTAGIPLGPQAGEVETIGVLDIVASAAELGVVACLALFLSTRRSAAPA